MAESTIRFKHGRGFTTIYNSVAQDVRLSLATRGLFTLMASLPQDWDYSISGLAVKANTTRYEVRKCIDNLQEVGYLEREQSHDNGGKFSGNVYVLQDEPPTVVPNCRHGESRQRCLPLSVNLTQQSKDSNKEKKEHTPIAPDEVLERATEYAGGDKALLDAIVGLLENRAVIKPKPKPVQTVRAMNGILRDLDKISGGNRELKLLLLDKATLCNWLTVYPLKPDELPQAAHTAADPGDAQRGRFL